MAKLIRGMTITLYEKKEVGTDPFGKPITEEVPIEIDNVIISPALSDDVTTQLNVSGKKAEYTLGIPKGDTHQWEDAEVEFFGRRWKTFGIPIEGMIHQIPLDWNKKVMVERYE